MARKLTLQDVFVWLINCSEGQFSIFALSTSPFAIFSRFWSKKSRVFSLAELWMDDSITRGGCMYKLVPFSKYSATRSIAQHFCQTFSSNQAKIGLVQLYMFEFEIFSLVVDFLHNPAFLKQSLKVLQLKRSNSVSKLPIERRRCTRSFPASDG